ncbi:hypothetical protein B0H15DRAFT_1009996 [Mycena belliarum]|uniref:Uncharacterized protein n=1 Tax=Mycena belliarum TaxID=1033014 RepID=A0AAD6TQ01_9AGAR|nr:hypothetical protein B0H15DRAFT_1009996 [Mycena belliae]
MQLDGGSQVLYGSESTPSGRPRLRFTLSVSAPDDSAPDDPPTRGCALVLIFSRAHATLFPDADKAFLVSGLVLPCSFRTSPPLPTARDIAISGALSASGPGATSASSTMPTATYPLPYWEHHITFCVPVLINARVVCCRRRLLAPVTENTRRPDLAPLCVVASVGRPTQLGFGHVSGRIFVRTLQCVSRDDEEECPDGPRKIAG